MSNTISEMSNTIW